jgi:hypothetical protein
MYVPASRYHFNTLTVILQDPEKLQARAARFGTGKPVEPAVGKKRSVEEVVDAEELEKRKKRADRFGIPHVVCLIPGLHRQCVLTFNQREAKLEICNIACRYQFLFHHSLA